MYILRDINNQIEEQIANGTNYYFDNYCSLVLNSIDLNSFYLDEKYVNIYFQQYDINTSVGFASPIIILNGIQNGDDIGNNDANMFISLVGFIIVKYDK